MATVIPFRAWRYNAAAVPMERVVAPPYDIISPAEQEALYANDPRNIIRVELGKAEPGDTAANNQYTRAAATMAEWTQKQFLEHDPAESFYLYETVFPHPEDGRVRRRLVLFGLIGLEPFSSKVVLPHEKTHAKAKEDRLKLLYAIHTNISPVFGLYEDKKKLANAIAKECSSEPPLYAFDFPEVERHRLWRISDPKKTEALSAMFRSKAILIADGHHRYETALNFRNELKRAHGITGPHASDYALMGFVEMEDEGLLIFPIHRVVRNLRAFDSKSFLEKLSSEFVCEKRDEAFLKTIAKGGVRPGFGICFRDAAFYLRLKDVSQAKRNMPAGKPEVWYGLEVARISHLVLKHLGIHDQNMEQHVVYTRFSEEATGSVKQGKADLAFLVPPIEASVMREICASGELMPQKSTYFFPKLGSGFLMYRHDA